MGAPAGGHGILNDELHCICRPFKPINIPDRTWPDRQITATPRWLSSDLRDGNQALVNPMNVEQKTRFFELVSTRSCMTPPNRPTAQL